MATAKKTGARKSAADSKADETRELTPRERRLAKYPRLAKRLEDLQEEREKIVKKSAPIRKKLDALHAKLEPLKGEERDLADEIAEIERPHLADIDNEIAALERAMGGAIDASPVVSSDETDE